MIKLPIFVTQRAAAPKKWVEFRQKSILAFRCSLATSYNDWPHRVMTMKLTGTDRQTDGQTNLDIGRQKLLIKKLVHKSDTTVMGCKVHVRNFEDTEIV